MTIYEIFEFRDGKSVKNVEGPVTYIRVEDNENKHEVLAGLGLPGNRYGYGFREVSDTKAENMLLKDAAVRALALEARFSSLLG